MEKILDLKVKNVTGFKSGRDTDLGLERGEIDCRATSDITVIREPWNRWIKDNYVTFVVQQGPDEKPVAAAGPDNRRIGAAGGETLSHVNERDARLH